MSREGREAVLLVCSSSPSPSHTELSNGYRSVRRGNRFLPVIFAKSLFKSSIISKYPCVWSTGTKGWILAISGQVTGNISVTAFSFMVQLPREIIEKLSAMSFFSNSFKYLMKGGVGEYRRVPWEDISV